MKNICKSFLVIATFTTSIGMAHAEKLNENIPQDMTCKEFVDMNPKAMRPVAFWIISKDTQFKGGDYVDWHEVDTTSVPLLIKICKSKPESKLQQWINDIR